MILCAPTLLLICNVFNRFKVEDVPFSVLGSVTSVKLNELINELLNTQVIMWLNNH